MRCYSHQHIRQSTITKHAYNGDSYRPINQIARRNEDEYALVGIPKVSNWWPIQFWPIHSYTIPSHLIASRDPFSCPFSCHIYLSTLITWPQLDPFIHLQSNQPAVQIVKFPISGAAINIYLWTY